MTTEALNATMTEVEPAEGETAASKPTPSTTAARDLAR